MIGLSITSILFVLSHDWRLIVSRFKIDWKRRGRKREEEEEEKTHEFHIIDWNGSDGTSRVPCSPPIVFILGQDGQLITLVERQVFRIF